MMQDDDNEKFRIGNQPRMEFYKSNSRDNNTRCHTTRLKSLIPLWKRIWIICGILLLFQAESTSAKYNDCQKFATSDTIEVSNAQNLLEIHIRQNIEVSIWY